ncbi:MAG: Rrf2 family transcriptional regulator [Bacteroidota bacterium]|nr:Rrf2 family transcriptional regulator [Candidatus Kapabacteria bacterium]MDW8219277.1 Rrf2 family transcriptional regulator [Bacteroidota bacterium]
MLRLSKKCEYALIALQYIAMHQGRVVSAKEIAEHYGLSFEFIAKTLQLLTRRKLIASHQGAAGGYVLMRLPTQISVAEVIEAVEGKPRIVQCCGEGNGDMCSMNGRCTIQMPMAILQRRIEEVLASTTLQHITLSDTSQYHVVHKPRIHSHEQHSNQLIS